MTRDDIIKLAREAGLVRAGDKWVEPARWGVTEVERFADLVAAAEREACAKLCDELAARDKLSNYYRIAAFAIRSREQDPMPLFDDWPGGWQK